MASKALLAASAALPLLAAAGAAHATVVGTGFAVSMTGTVANTEASVTTTGTGTGSLDNVGAFPYSLTTTVDVAIGGSVIATALVDSTDSFNGTFASGTLTVTSATAEFTSCTGSSLVCTTITTGVSASSAAT